jgi:hypothetical protein
MYSFVLCVRREKEKRSLLKKEMYWLGFMTRGWGVCKCV